MTDPVGVPLAASRRRSHRHRTVTLPGWTVGVAASVAVLARLPFLGRAPSPDEAGFLVVGSQWNGRGTSLYTDYWVDRPPLLVTIFRAASSLGGVPALRVIGCVAVVVVVLGCARGATMLHGEQAARWAALTAATLVTTPLLGGYALNGEMLAAPFVIAGIICVVSALRTSDVRPGIGWGVLAGACAMCALMVKQNFADVAVFGAVALVVSAIRSDITWRRFASLTAAATAGAVFTLSALALWTTMHGTSLVGVFDAMYPFRVEAAHVIAEGGQDHALARLGGLADTALLSMIAPLTAGALLGTVRMWRRPLSCALLSLLVFAAASVLVGGNFWHHYLIGLIVPVSLAVGVMAADHVHLIRPIAALAVASAALGWAGSLALPQGDAAQTIGTAVGSVSRSGDTIVNLYGDPDVVQASGLASPYEHLWSLPIKTRDPTLRELDAILAGATAPTWLVTGSTVRTWGLQTTGTGAIIARRYRKVGVICGRTIYLLDGVHRADVRSTGREEPSVRTCPPVNASIWRWGQPRPEASSEGEGLDGTIQGDLDERPLEGWGRTAASAGLSPLVGTAHQGPP